MLQTLGIHSNVLGDAKLTGGHAWLTLYFPNGRSTSVGLWTDTMLEARRFVRDPTGFILGETFDVSWGLEIAKHYQARASRYYALSPAQARQATATLSASPNWRYTHTCASWATEVVKRLVGEELNSAELLGATNTPRALGNAIEVLERKRPTSLRTPLAVRHSPINETKTQSKSSSI